MAPVPKTGGL
uniref:Uncharacterized protein n=1 Tax=Anguilla anguilla TaxID=7936 RepID=A0A0E9PSY9_ANGAN